MKYDFPTALRLPTSSSPPPKPEKRPETVSKTDFSLVCDNPREENCYYNCGEEVREEEELFCTAEEGFGQKSRIRAQEFKTFLLPKDCRPLEPSALVKVQSVLLESGARVLANHLLKSDLEFSRSLDLNPILLPIGRQLRRDLIERHFCLKYFVLISVLTTISGENRKLVLNKWIEIAIEIKSALGDLFGFAAVMEALGWPPMTRLTRSWAEIRRDFTQNAIIYETKLKPQLKAMIEATYEPGMTSRDLC